MFERESGTLDDVLKCVEKTKTVLKAQVQQAPQNEVRGPTSENYEVRSEQRQRKRKYDEEERDRKFNDKRSKHRFWVEAVDFYFSVLFLLGGGGLNL